ncbi:MAG: MATE family efflux transporter [Ruminococcaceae bacterium]|nr:MATE family efflux transporter [Oscillospiraceae bacterium]
MKIQLSEHFNYAKLLKFTFPSIVMIIFTSIYGVVDGFFVSNIVGKTPFAAVNFIMPVLMILGSFGFMFGTGGSALIAKTMGEGKKDKANRLFSMFVYSSFILGVVISVVSIIFIPQIAHLLGARENMLKDSVLYSRVILAALPFYMLQFEFQSFFVAAQKPQLGLYVTVASGVSNMVLDALFVAVFKWGLLGAALATAVSQFVGGVVPVIYFLRPNTSLLHLTKTSYDSKAMIKACTNGSSELMSNISMSIVGMLYNIQLLKYAGENGIASYGVLMYVNMIFLAAFIGYSVGTAPVISYHYGAQNHDELKSLLKKSLVIISVFSLLMFILSQIFAYPLSYIFVGYDKDLMSMTVNAFYIFSFSFLFAGLAIFGSGFFTALNDGLTSAVISFLRTLVFQAAAVIILPIILKLGGIWVSIVVAEVMAFIITVIFIMAKKKKYRY